MNAPELELGLELFYVGFTDLTSSRQIGESGDGPISWGCINEYCRENELVGEQREDMLYHVQHLDMAYLKWAEARRKREAAKTRPPSKRQRT